MFVNLYSGHPRPWSAQCMPLEFSLCVCEPVFMPPATCTKYTAEVLLVFVGPCLGHPHAWPAQSIPLGSYLWHVFFVKVFVANANATHIYNLHKVYHWGILCVFVGQYLGHPHPAQSMPLYSLCVCGPVFRPPTASTKSATGVSFVCLRVNK